LIHRMSETAKVQAQTQNQWGRDGAYDRFGKNAVIPIRYHDAPDGYFSSSYGFGSLSFDPNKPIEPQAELIVETICKRLEEDRIASGSQPL
ncbi:hypothetical protein, partial [Ochrobactrum sp. C6C9]|uniref:hypothetical protein n=1 Tax=Ochrobactrum sp. C6C9 TaxID=2736662 RepID=UPI00353032A3